jgi:hypothetical protein
MLIKLNYLFFVLINDNTILIFIKLFFKLILKLLKIMLIEILHSLFEIFLIFCKTITILKT